MPSGRRAAALLAAASLFAAACTAQPKASEGKPTRGVGEVLSRTPEPPVDSAAAAPRDTGPDERPRLARLEREARALVRTEGCSSAAACRTAPVGWRGCGGPRAYLVYCAATTDTVALFRKLAELEAAERDYNARSGMMSTCEYRVAPAPQLRGGSCREGRAGMVPVP